MNKLLDSEKKRLIVVIICIVVVLLFSFLYFKINSLYHIGIPCMFHEITGLYCPGCGITRALFALFRLDLQTALRNNILIFILAPFLLYYVIIKIKNWIFLKETQILPNLLVYIMLVITIIFGILRNINYFDFLRPLI